ncbi:hypothetical protein EDD15DRAFT_2192705 [Pisolithus albus]|nr:hypothetical protein EDD15DRAFT_2192705 [Pisolithus albus]
MTQSQRSIKSLSNLGTFYHNHGRLVQGHRLYMRDIIRHSTVLGFSDLFVQGGGHYPIWSHLGPLSTCSGAQFQSSCISTGGAADAYHKMVFILHHTERSHYATPRLQREEHLYFTGSAEREGVCDWLEEKVCWMGGAESGARYDKGKSLAFEDREIYASGSGRTFSNRMVPTQLWVDRNLASKAPSPATTHNGVYDKFVTPVSLCSPDCRLAREAHARPTDDNAYSTSPVLDTRGITLQEGAGEVWVPAFFDGMIDRVKVSGTIHFVTKSCSVLLSQHWLAMTSVKLACYQRSLCDVLNRTMRNLIILQLAALLSSVRSAASHYRIIMQMGSFLVHHASPYCNKVPPLVTATPTLFAIRPNVTGSGSCYPGNKDDEKCISGWWQFRLFVPVGWKSSADSLHHHNFPSNDNTSLILSLWLRVVDTLIDAGWKYGLVCADGMG